MRPIPALCHSNKFPSRSDEPASDIDIAAVDSLKALGHQRPIREADIAMARDEGAGGGGSLYFLSFRGRSAGFAFIS